MAEFQIGQTVETDFGGKAVISGIIGKGRQSTVYTAEYNSMKMALKWYDISKVRSPEKIYRNLKGNIADGSPNSKFLWPKYLTGKDGGSFGYFMEIKPDSFEYFADIMKGYKLVHEGGRVAKKSVKFTSLNAMITAVINIVNIFRTMNAKGKSWQALSDGGFFVNINTGAVLVSDCDVIAPHGIDLDIIIRPSYKAPEVLGGGVHNADSDLYTLAVVLFRLLFRGDPMEGEKFVMDLCMNEAETAVHYGENAVFVYDPDDDSNRPLKGIHDNVLKFWNEFPDYIKDAFLRSFTVGKKDPSQRLHFDEWQSLFIRLRSEILSCVCGRSHFVSLLGNPKDKVFRCPKCNTEFATIGFSNRSFRMPLYMGCRIFDCEINPYSDDFLSVAGVLVENKIRPGLLGIKNCSEKIWKVKMPDGVFHEVNPGKGFPVWNGLEINFGRVQAKF